jgi:hypothetical protein
MAVMGERLDTSALQASRSHGRHVSASSSKREVRLGSLVRALALVGIVGAAWLLRVTDITRNYDIFIDEVTYTQIAVNLANGHGLMLYGVPFDLHPPAGLALYALAIKAFGLHGGLATILFGLRPFAALLGSITCGVAAGLVGALAGWRAGAAVAVIAALDPFEIFFDSRVMLEAPGQLATALSILLLAMSLRSRSESRSWSLVVLCGLAGGAAMCTKEDFGLVLGLTLLLCLATGWVTARYKVAAALAIMCGCYTLSESLVIATTGFQPWWSESTGGLHRLIGSEQIAGFNSATVHVSLISRVTANASHFGFTYLILGFGALAGTYQVIAAIRCRRDWSSRSRPTDRGRLLVAFWSVAATLYLVYATLFGALEEQVYYALFIPGLCALVLLASHVLPLLARYWRKIAVAVVASIILADSAVWMAVHRTPDDEYRQLLAWAPKNLRPGSTVSVTEGTAQFIMRGVVLGQWATVPELIKHHVDYVLLSTTLISQGYGIGTPQFEQYLQRHAAVVFRATGPSEGALILYNVRAITGARP